MSHPLAHTDSGPGLSLTRAALLPRLKRIYEIVRYTILNWDTKGDSDVRPGIT